MHSYNEGQNTVFKKHIEIEKASQIHFRQVSKQCFKLPALNVLHLNLRGIVQSHCALLHMLQPVPADTHAGSQATASITDTTGPLGGLSKQLSLPA